MWTHLTHLTHLTQSIIIVYVRKGSALWMSKPY